MVLKSQSMKSSRNLENDFGFRSIWSSYITDLKVNFKIELTLDQVKFMD